MGETTVFVGCCETELSDCKHNTTADLHYIVHTHLKMKIIIMYLS